MILSIYVFKSNLIKMHEQMWHSKSVNSLINNFKKSDHDSQNLNHIRTRKCLKIPPMRHVTAPHLQSNSKVNDNNISKMAFFVCQLLPNLNYAILKWLLNRRAILAWIETFPLRCEGFNVHPSGLAFWPTACMAFASRQP